MAGTLSMAPHMFYNVGLIGGIAVSRTWTLLLLDALLFAVLLLLTEPRTEGLAWHEWLGLAILAPILLHLHLAWRWIRTLPARLRARGAWRLRVNALLNGALFVSLIVTVFSGAMTSFIALPALGIGPGDFEGWRLLHRQWEAYLEITAALHVAMNGSWIVHAVRRIARSRQSIRAPDIPLNMLEP